MTDQGTGQPTPPEPPPPPQVQQPQVQPEPPAEWQQPSVEWQQPTYAAPPPVPAYQQQPPPPPGYGQPSYPGQAMAPYPGGPGSIGQVRSTGICILLFIVTLGIYGWVWWYKVQNEMKRHTGQGLGGGISLLLAILVTVVMPYITSSEVGGLYTRRGQQAPVTGVTGLWYFPGNFILVGPIIWFVKTNEALNTYWRSVGAVG